MVENHTRKNINTLITDNGTEYESNVFNDFCKEASIKRVTIVPYSPQQNAFIERKNQTMMEATHAMIYDQDLPKFLWGEVVKIVVYVQNRSPHQSFDFKTPKEVFTCKKLHVQQNGYQYLRQNHADVEFVQEWSTLM